MDAVRTRHAPGRKPPFWVSLTITLLLVAVMTLLRLTFHRHQFVPLGFGVPLVVCLWTRDRISLWVMAGAFTVIALLKIFVVMPGDAFGSTAQEWGMAGMMLANIHIVAAMVHAAVGYRERIESANAQLETTNAELEAGNEELAAREEQISRQNEELQSQAEELEQQAEELQQQTEELQQQAEQLQQSNEELVRREQALSALLESAALLDGRNAHDKAMAKLCDVATGVLAEEPVAAAIVQRQGDQVVVRGHCCFGPGGPEKQSWEYSRSLASLVMERGRTARLDDTSLRPDLEMPRPNDGRTFRSVLAAPLRVHGQAVGALEIFSETPRHWTEQDFRVADWLASQAGLVLESMTMRQELERRQQEAEETSRRKTRFLAAVSHDVRTPANAINLMAELICRAASDPCASGEIPDLARDLQANARALVELVSDVLDLARFDSGKLDAQEMDFDLAAAVRREAQQLEPLAADKGLRLSTEGCDAPIWLRADRMKLARILGNLIGNAIKFTERGSVTVRCQRLHTGCIQIQVIDTGVGISPEHLPHIFDEFRQLGNPERDRTKGAGLGLAICKRLADALGCQLSVQSQSGQGTTFTLRTPAAAAIHPPMPAPAAKAEPARTPGSLAGLRVLLVEDHDTTRRATTRLLASEGAIVAQAATGREALHLLAHESPEVLLLDLMLPDLDGSEILRHLQGNRPASLRCVLAVSGDVTESRLEQIKRLGADGLMPKPVDIDRLVEVLRRDTLPNPVHPAT